MPTSSEIYTKLVLDIATAKANRDKLYKSLYDDSQPGGGWITAVTNECGAAYSPSKTFASYPKGSSACASVLKIVSDRLKLIAIDDANILLWQAQVNELLKDPQLQQDLADQELNRKIKTGIIVVAVLAALSGVLIFLWKKYGKK